MRRRRQPLAYVTDVTLRYATLSEVLLTRVCDRFSISIEVTLSNATTDRLEGESLYKRKDRPRLPRSWVYLCATSEVTHDTTDDP